MRWFLVNVCRFVVAAAFIFSGVTKMIDPHGTEYKLQDYAHAFGVGGLMPSTIAIAAGMLLALFEFRVGLCALFGIYRRMTARFALAFMLVFTPLTLYLALANPVSDCGCFGDAWVLTNWQTFAKNVVLLTCAVVMTRWYALQFRAISENRQWIILMYSQLFVLCMGFYGLWRLPLVDFRPFYIGANIEEAMRPGGDAEYVTTFLMEKDGEQRWFTLEEYPDSTWTYVDSKTEVVGEQIPAAIDNLQMYTLEDGEDITEEVLADEGYTFLLSAPFLDKADDGHMDAYNRIYDYAVEKGYRFLCLTSSGEEEIAHWQDLTGAEYPFCHTDALTLKTMVRSNPGLLLLKGGVVIGKWPFTAMPELDEGAAPLEELPIGTLKVDGTLRMAMKFALWFIVPLLIITFLDRVWWGWSVMMDRRRNKKQNIVKHLNKENNEKEDCSR